MHNALKIGGHLAEITDVHCRHTYAGVLEFSSFAYANARLLQRARTRMEPLWGKRAIVLLNPYCNKAELLLSPTKEMRREPLPQWSLYVWLESNWTSDPNAFKSELIIGFFVDDVVREPISTIVQRAASGLPWEDYAQDFFV